MRERPKFGHNPTNTWTKQDLGKIMWAFVENKGTNLQALYSSSAVWKHKNRNYVKNNNFVFNSGRALCKSGRAQGSSGREQDSKGRTQHPKYA